MMIDETYKNKENNYEKKEKKKTRYRYTMIKTERNKAICGNMNVPRDSHAK